MQRSRTGVLEGFASRNPFKIYINKDFFFNNPNLNIRLII